MLSRTWAAEERFYLRRQVDILPDISQGCARESSLSFLLLPVKVLHEITNEQWHWAGPALDSPESQSLSELLYPFLGRRVLSSTFSLLMNWLNELNCDLKSLTWPLCLHLSLFAGSQQTIPSTFWAQLSLEPQFSPSPVSSDSKVEAQVALPSHISLPHSEHCGISFSHSKPTELTWTHALHLQHTSGKHAIAVQQQLWSPSNHFDLPT